MIDMENLSLTERQFKNAAAAAGIPVSGEEYRALWQNAADNVNLPIANTNPISAFWSFCNAAITGPALWLTALMIRTVMPNMYVKTASGVFLDLLAYAYNLERKPAIKAGGKLTFSRTPGAQPLLIPAGTRVRTVPINGNIYRMTTAADAVIESGTAQIDVPCLAEAPGAFYNLGANYYAIMDSDVPGVTAVTNPADWLATPGADAESDEQLRLRIRYQFASAGDWHTDARYRSIIAANTGFRPDRIFFMRYDADNYVCRGPGSADAFVLFDAGTVPDATLATVNQYVRTQGNHGHGDDLQVKALPSSSHAVTAHVIFRSTVTITRRAVVIGDIEQAIRCAFRENQDYLDQISQTWPFSRFSFSKLDYELHGLFPEIESLVWGQTDIVSQLDVPRLSTLTVEEQP